MNIKLASPDPSLRVHLNDRSSSRDILPFMSTADAANDLELLRRAIVGGSTTPGGTRSGGGSSGALMNYYGMSYGTVLGVRSSDLQG